MLKRRRTTPAPKVFLADSALARLTGRSAVPPCAKVRIRLHSGRSTIGRESGDRPVNAKPCVGERLWRSGLTRGFARVYGHCQIGPSGERAPFRLACASDRGIGCPFGPPRSRILSLTADRPVNAARSVSLAFSHPTEIWISRFVYRASSANQTAFDCVAGLLRRIGALVVAPRTTCPGGNCCLRSRTAQASRAHFLCVYRFRASRVTIGTGVGLR